MKLVLTKDQADSIWAALCKQEEYLIGKACEDQMYDETRIGYIMELKHLREAKEIYIKAWS